MVISIGLAGWSSRNLGSHAWACNEGETMSSGRTIALLAAALLALGAAGCGTVTDTTTMSAPSTAVPQTATTGTAVTTEAVPESMPTSTTTSLPVTTVTEVLPGDGLDEDYAVYSALHPKRLQQRADRHRGHYGAA